MSIIPDTPRSRPEFSIDRKTTYGRTVTGETPMGDAMPPLESSGTPPPGDDHAALSMGTLQTPVRLWHCSVAQRGYLCCGSPPHRTDAHAADAARVDLADVAAGHERCGAVRNWTFTSE